MLHIQVPYSITKRLGVAYNDAMRNIDDDDWMCFIDHDVLFLTADTIFHLNEYAGRNADAGLLVCYGSRSHPLSKEQKLKITDTDSIKYHSRIALQHQKFLYQTNIIKEPHRVSGFLMLLSKKIWKEIKFNEQRNCLWVDTDFCNALKEKNKKIIRMEGIYIWHSYRLLKDINDKSHLL